MHRFKKRLAITNDASGWVLVSAIVVITFLTALGLTLASYVALQYEHSSYEEYAQNAQLTAEAGIEQSVDELNASSTFTGYSTPQVFFNNSTQGYGVFTTAITSNPDGKSKYIVSYGDVYINSSAANPFVTRSIKVVVVGTQSGGYSVMTGPGGLILGGTANVTNSSVYVAGTITMNGASKIGTYNNPLTVEAANDACPTGPNPGSTYPEVCTTTQPISLSNNSKIYGSVCATGQTSTGPNNNIQTGNGGAGLEVGCTAPVSSPPSYDRLSQIQAVTTSASGTNSDFVCGNGTTGSSWPANLELTGNVSIGGNCGITLNGNVWITGNLSIDGSASFTVANGLDTTHPVIMVDGTISIGGSSSMVANSSGTGVEFISFLSDNSCTIGTTSTTYCSSLSGNDLYNSQTMQTITVGSSVKTPGAIFDSYWSEVVLNGSGAVGAATGQTVYLNGSGSVVFGTTLASNTTTWTISSYEPYR